MSSDTISLINGMSERVTVVGESQDITSQRIVEELNDVINWYPSFVVNEKYIDDDTQVIGLKSYGQETTFSYINKLNSYTISLGDSTIDIDFKKVNNVEFILILCDFVNKYKAGNYTSVIKYTNKDIFPKNNALLMNQLLQHNLTKETIDKLILSIKEIN